MNNIIKQIEIDVYTPTFYEVIKAQQNDENSRFVEFILYNQGEPYVIPENVLIKLEGQRANKSPIMKPCTVANNIVTVELDKDLLYYSGVAHLKLVIYKEDENSVLSTIPFTVSIQKNPLDSNKFEKDNYSLVHQLVLQTETNTKNLNNEIKRAKEAEKVITDNLDAEITRAKKAESDLNSKKIDKTTVASSSTLGLVKSGTDITVDESGNVNVNDNSHNHTVSNISDLTATATELNYTDGVTSNIQTQINSKAPLENPTFTGTPKAPTASAGTNTTQLATTAFVQTAVSNLVDSATSISSKASNTKPTVTDSTKAPIISFKGNGYTLQDGTPTPDNPIPIRSYGDMGWFDGELSTQAIDGHDGAIFTNDNLVSSLNYIDCNPGDLIKVIPQLKSDSVNIIFFDINKNFISGVPADMNVGGCEAVAPSNSYYFKFNLEKTGVGINPQIAGRITVLKNGMYCAPVKSVGKNLISGNPTGNNIALTKVKANKEYTLCLTQDASIGFNLRKNNVSGEAIIANKISIGNNVIVNFIADEDFTLFYNGYQDKNQRDYILVYGLYNEFIPYEPYQESAALIPTLQPFYEGDYIQLNADGTGVEHRESKRIVLDGSDDETLYYENNAKYATMYAFLVDLKTPSSNDSLTVGCNRFQKCINLEDMDGTYRIFINNAFQIYCPLGTFTDINTGRAWLQSNPVEVIYPLTDSPLITLTDTPLTDKQLSEIKKLMSFDNQTTFSTEPYNTRFEIRYYKSNNNGKTVGGLNDRITRIEENDDITPESIGALPITGGVMTGDIGISRNCTTIKYGCSVPASGEMGGSSIEALGLSKTFFGRFKDSSTDANYNMISIRDSNGAAEEGKKYGMYIKTERDNYGDLKWAIQQNGSWQNEKTIIDSSNVSSYTTTTDSPFIYSKVGLIYSVYTYAHNWIDLGILTINSPSDIAIIDWFGGNGWNGLSSQNDWFRLFIKKGYQGDPEVIHSNSNGCVVYTYGTGFELDRNVVEVRCVDAPNKMHIWVNCPYQYASCYVNVYVRGTFKKLDIVTDTSPSQGILQNCERYDMTKNYNDIFAKKNIYGDDKIVKGLMTFGSTYGGSVGDSSIVYGENCEAPAVDSCALGYYTKAGARYTCSFGAYTHATNVASTALGKFNADMVTDGNHIWASTASTAFSIGNGTSEYARSNAFSVMFDGVVKAKSTITGSTTADYAEFFEWLDGNSNGEDRVGHFVTLDGDKIRYATEKDEYILGIVSGEPFVLGNGDCDTWNGMYLKDEFGRTLYEPAPVMEVVDDEETGKIKLIEKTDENGNTIYEGTRPILNPDYDPNQKYISRFDRKEWAPIGMLGVLSVYDDGTCEVNGYCKCNNDAIATKSDIGYRVIKRVADNIIKICLFNGGYYK